MPRADLFSVRLTDLFSVRLMAEHSPRTLDAIINLPAAEMVQLDVGGERLVEMSPSALLQGRAADSLLAAAVRQHLAAQSNATDSSASTSAGAPLFVDASAASLQPVLAWLRTGIAPCIAARRTTTLSSTTSHARSDSVIYFRSHAELPLFELKWAFWGRSTRQRCTFCRVRLAVHSILAAACCLVTCSTFICDRWCRCLTWSCAPPEAPSRKRTHCR